MPETAAVQVREAQLVQLIVFVLGEEEFAVPIGEVREIIRLSPITPVPEAPGFIEGVLNVRGEIAAVIDLKARFGLPAPKETVAPKHIIISQQEKNLFGLKVDEVTQVLRIPEKQIQPAPEVVTRVHGDYVTGVITLERRLIVLLELNKVLSEEELAKMTEVRQRQEGSALSPEKGKIAPEPEEPTREEPEPSSPPAPGQAKRKRRRR